MGLFFESPVFRFIDAGGDLFERGPQLAGLLSTRRLRKRASEPQSRGEICTINIKDSYVNHCPSDAILTQRSWTPYSLFTALGMFRELTTFVENTDRSSHLRGQIRKIASP